MKNYLPTTEIEIVAALLLVLGGGGFLTLAIWGTFIGISIFAAAGIALSIVLAIYLISIKRISSQR